MASIRKRGNSYLIVVSMGYGADGKRAKAAQKTVKPPEGLTAKQTEKWLQEQAVLFESGIKKGGVASKPSTEKNITFADYTAHWLAEVAPHKLAKSTLVRSRHELARVLPHIGRVRLQDLRADHFRALYAAMRKEKNKRTGAPLAEKTVEGLHAVVCSVLSSAMEENYLAHNPAWRTYRWQGARTERTCADRETLQTVLEILEQADKKYEVYFKLIIATGIRRGKAFA